MAYNPLNPNGQAAMAASQPVVIASNQSPVSVAGSLNIVGTPSISGTVNVAQIPSIYGNISGSVVAFQGTNPWIITGSVQASLTPAANQSVSGTVGASIIGLTPVAVTNTPSVSGTVLVGNFPTTQNVSGSVVATQGTNPWVISGSVQGSFAPSGNQSVSGTVGASVIGIVPVAIVSGSIAASFTPPANQSVSGTVQTDVRGSIAAVIIGGSIAASFIPPANQSVSGTVQTDVRGSIAAVIIGGSIAASFIPPANQSVSGTVGASILGNVNTTITSVATIGGFLNVNLVGGSILTSSTPNQSVSGTVGASIIGLVPVVLSSGSILAVPAGNQSVSGSLVVTSLLSMPAIISTANSTTAPVTSTLSFTGTGEEWKDFGSIVINVFTDAASGTDGLSIQQSSDNANWDIRDVYTIPSMAAGSGKTFQVQPAARFGRIVYTQGAVNSGAFRLQTIYHPQYVKPTSQRAQDAYSNETDLEQNQNFGMVYNGATWDRTRGNATNGTLIFGSVQTAQTGTRITSVVSTTPSSVLVGASIFGQLPGGTAVLGSVATLQGTNPWIITGSVQGSFSPSGNQSVSGTVNIGTGGPVSVMGTMSVLGTVPVTQATSPWVIGSIVGTYSEDIPSTGADKGLFTLGIRNDTVASLVGNDLDYTGWSTDSAGRHLVKPFAADEVRLDAVSSVNGTSVTALFTSVTGLRNYVTDIMVANTGSVATLVTFKDGSTSILGFTIAPAGGGSNIIGMNFPFRTAPAQDFTYTAAIASSVLYVTAKGYKAP